MNESIDFRLPGDDDPRATGRRDRSGLAALLSALTLAVGVGVAGLLVSMRSAGEPKSEGPLFDAAILARRLEDRGLRLAAAEAWEEAAVTPGASRGDRARSFFRAGQLLREAGQFERALAAYAKSELVEPIPDLAGELDRARAECYRRLGNWTGLEAEIRAGTSLGGSDEAAADVVLAEIGSRKITRGELDRTVEVAVEEELRGLGGGVSEQRLAEEKKRLLDRLSTPEARVRLVEDLVTRELLRAEAAERGLAAQPEVEAEIERLREGVLARRLVESEIESAVSIGESDLRDHYEAHRDAFRVPERVEVRRIVCETRERAREAVAAIEGGRSFAECVAEFSVEPDRARTGGRIPGGIEKGAPIPGIGSDPVVQAALFELEPGAWTREPMESDGRYHLFEAIDRTPERIRPFDEVRAEVERRKRAEKESEAVAAFLDRLRQKYGVTVFRGRLGGAGPSAPEVEDR